MPELRPTSRPRTFATVRAIAALKPRPASMQMNEQVQDVGELACDISFSPVVHLGA